MSEPIGSRDQGAARAPQQPDRAEPPLGGAASSPGHRPAADAVPGDSSGHRPPVDHAGSTLCRLVSHAPEVAGVRMLGQEDAPDGSTSYSLSVMLPGGRELLVDVRDL